jgi:3-methyladenine DNA glycosylase AlkD
MSSNKISILDKFFSLANKSQAEKNLYNLKRNKYSFKEDKVLGISMLQIKDTVKETEEVEISTVFKLIQSEYNEARILGWALLVRDFSESSILKYFILHEAKNCKNWNVVDFAAPICSKMLIKRDGYEACENVGYSLLFKEESDLSVRFSLMMAVPFIKKEKLRYAIDIIERCLDYSDPTIQQGCGQMLKEIGLINQNILKYFIKDHEERLSLIIKNELTK